MTMKVFGVTLVRSEADIIALTLRYHLQLGLDSVLVLDNASSDGTDKILEQLAREDDRIRWSRHEGEFQQAELTTGLAREAFRAGADWIVPFDADEFWYAPHRAFREILADSKAGALRAQVIHYIQAREQLARNPEALRTMTRRAAWTVGPPDARALVEAQKIGYVEAMYLPKWISRASVDLEIGAGNHRADNLAAKPGDDGGDCLPARAHPIAGGTRSKSVAKPTTRGGAASLSGRLAHPPGPAPSGGRLDRRGVGGE